MGRQVSVSRSAMGSLRLSRAILDGEVCHELPDGVTNFGALQADLSEGKTAHLVFFAFDLLYRRHRAQRIDPPYRPSRGSAWSKIKALGQEQLIGVG